MDKKKVILAYHRGFVTIQECAQILGMDIRQVKNIVQESKSIDLTQQTINR